MSRNRVFTYREQAARWRLFTRAARVSPLLSVEHEDVVFLIPTWDQGVGRRLFVAGWRREIHLLSRAMEILARRGHQTAGRVFVDVGANIGTTVLPALLTHGFSRAVAIEPEPSNVRTLRAAAALNGAQGGLVVIQAAAADADRTAALKLHRRNSGGHRLVEAGAAGTLAVRAAPLESLLAEAVVEPEDVGLLWIDAQGSEEAIMRAALNFVGSVPVVLEIAPKRWNRLADLIGQYEHAIDLRSGKTMQTVELRPGRRYTDLLLVPPMRQDGPDDLESRQRVAVARDRRVAPG